MEQNQIIEAIIRTLETVRVSGSDDMQKMLGVINAVKQLYAEERKGEDDGR